MRQTQQKKGSSGKLHTIDYLKRMGVSNRLLYRIGRIQGGAGHRSQDGNRA
jgi:hypothetical protein